jgi:lipopolysaccharide transport system permease protein
VYPVFMFAVYYFIFAELLQLKFGGLPEHYKPAMGIYMFVGVLVWTGFAEGLMRAGGVIVDNGNLIKKLAFPTDLLPFNAVLVAKTTMLFGVGVFVVVLWASVLGRDAGFWEHGLWPSAPGVRLLWVPVLVAVQLLFTYGLGLLLSTLQVFLRDTMHLMGILVLTWMFITPVFWVASDKVIAGIEQHMGALAINPMFHLMNCWRDVLMVGRPAALFESQPSFLHSLGVFSLWAVGAFLVGYLFFLRSQRRFADEV